MAILTATIGDRQVPLTDCDWVLWAPCGCPRGVCLAQVGDTVLATEDRAHAEFTSRRRDRAREIREGYRIELVTHHHYRAVIASLMATRCPHR
ncbi:hypothetical protein NE857_31425 [Nocardiopsis exhalans]|uniref:Uncharacterized protein n=1 Tax=Nocardiopsis exhalans TaxID=163604 RepID=A0ABY5D8H8_9ACTN|nr:hypothetical protein [Nocardiopsis exhalans]USY19690.1 hypothetical protein NE857_31425 [Nocardiopsis exhalans]